MRYFPAAVAHGDVSGIDSEVRERARETGSGGRGRSGRQKARLHTERRRSMKSGVQASSHARTAPLPRGTAGEIDLSEADRRGS